MILPDYHIIFHEMIYCVGKSPVFFDKKKKKNHKLSKYRKDCDIMDAKNYTVLYTIV